jgi:hypothetical protein
MASDKTDTNPNIRNSNRRRFLKTVGAATVAGFTFAGTTAAKGRDDEEDELPNSVTITGLGDEQEGYGVGVTGVLSADEWEPGDGKPPWAGGDDEEDENEWEPGDGKPPWAGGGDEEDDSTGTFAQGSVTTEPDEYRFSGQIESITDFETFRVDVNEDDKTLSVTDLRSDPSARRLYEIYITDSVSLANDADVVIDSNDVAASTVFGSLKGSTAVFNYQGKLEEVVFEASLQVRMRYSSNPDTGFNPNDTSEVVEFARIFVDEPDRGQLINELSPEQQKALARALEPGELAISPLYVSEPTTTTDSTSDGFSTQAVYRRKRYVATGRLKSPISGATVARFVVSGYWKFNGRRVKRGSVSTYQRTDHLGYFVNDRGTVASFNDYRVTVAERFRRRRFSFDPPFLKGLDGGNISIRVFLRGDGTVRKRISNPLTRS